MLRELEKRIMSIDNELQNIEGNNLSPAQLLMKKQLERNKNELLEALSNNLTPADRVSLARHPMRPGTREYISHLFTDFFIQKGDRLCKEDESILGGLAFYKGQPVTVIGQCKGKNLEENIKYNFGMPGPEGYRKVIRLAKQAEKFSRPIITFIDTPGAYPGLEAEERGQGEAIAKCLSTFCDLEVPVIAIVIGEGGSGGALALGVANTIIMLENSIFSVLSPEGFASILWKNVSRSDEACEIMKLTAGDLYDFKIIDHIVKEPAGGAHRDPEDVFGKIDNLLYKEICRLSSLSRSELADERYKKFREMGNV